MLHYFKPITTVSSSLRDVIGALGSAMLGLHSLTRHGFIHLYGRGSGELFLPVLIRVKLIGITITQVFRNRYNIQFVVGISAWF